MKEFLRTCIFVRWFNVAVIDGLSVPSMYVVAPHEGKEQKCLTAINNYLTEKDETGEWATLLFKGKIILGR